MAEKFMDFYTKAEINAMLNGLSFRKMSKEDFDALTIKDGSTVYYVYDEGGNITQYFGDVQLTSGGGAESIMLLTTPIPDANIPENVTKYEPL